MVLQHVARGAAAVVITAARADAEFFGDGDLDVVDVAAVPQGLEDRVGETQDEQILDGLLAEVVVDAEDLRLAEVARGDGVEVDGGSRSLPKGFSMMTLLSRSVPRPRAARPDWPRFSRMGSKTDGGVET